MTPWRKVSLASWKPRGDSSCYSYEEVIMDEIIDYCKDQNINLNSFLIKALSQTISLQPKINSTIRWGKVYNRREISVFFHTVQDAIMDDLSGIILTESQQKSLKEVNSEFIAKISASKKGQTDFTESKKITAKTPAFLTKPLLNIYSFVTYTLNRNMSVFKMKNNAFGSIMLTSVGSLGISNALCPIAPYTKIPMVISVGKIIEKPVVLDHEIVIRKTITFGFTFDHRIMDGIHFAEFLNCLKTYFSHPKNMENA